MSDFSLVDETLNGAVEPEPGYQFGSLPENRSQAIREAYERGEWLSDNALSNRLHVSHSLPGLIRKNMRDQGWTFETRIGGPPTNLTLYHVIAPPLPGAPQLPPDGVDPPRPNREPRGIAIILRERLEAGEWLNGLDVATEYQCSKSALPQVLNQYRNRGQGVRQKQEKNRRTYYQLASEAESQLMTAAGKTDIYDVKANTPRPGTKRDGIYQALLSGKRMHAVLASEIYGCSRTALFTVVRTYFANDPRLRQERDGQNIWYSLDLSGATALEPVLLADQSLGRSAAMPRLRPPKAPVLPTMPTLGGRLRVVGMVLRDESDVEIALQDDDGSAWTCLITGHTQD
jgi:hypothetical protein